MTENHIVVQKTARYFTIGQLTEATTEIWLCLHGYRQSGMYFGSNFKAFELPHRLIIIPEALNRFYIEGYSGRVGNAWMTAEDRASEIVDHCYYLETLMLHFLSQAPNNVSVNVLAFSQGTATASRWIMQSNVRINRLICYAGKLAHELHQPELFSQFPVAKVDYFIGTQDEFVTPEQLVAWKKELDELKANYTFTVFEGRHKIYAEVLNGIFNA